MGMTRGAPQKLSGEALCTNGDSLGVSQLATSERPELEEATDGVTPKTPEQLRFERYEKMLQRAGFSPATHLKHLQKCQKKEGADAMSLGVTSRRLYEEISGNTAFDEFFFEIPSKKSALEMMPDVARKILSKDSTADVERTKEKTEAEMTTSRGMSKHQGFEEETKVRPEGPPMLTLPPQKDMLNSEGKQAILSEREMEGFVTYRFADGFTYKGTMHENRPCGEGTAQYANGGEYVGGWLNGKYQGYGRMTSPTGTVYEGDWYEGRRSGKGKLTYKSGSTYEGDFLLGVFHGRGRFESANANVIYEGRWNSGFVWGHGMLILADGTKVVRSWPTRSRFGGGLSLRSAVELVRSEQEMAQLNRLDKDKELYQVANHMELQSRVKVIRQDIANRRAEKKANEKMESAEQRKAAKIAAMETQLEAQMDAEREEEQDGIEKEFNA